MTERGFNTKFWTDPFIRKLEPDAKLLYAYLWTNDHCNQAGLYEISLDIMAFDTKINENKLPDLLNLLLPKIMWYRELDIIWVKSFVHHQAKSPKFLIAIARCLKNVSNNGLIKEYIDYNNSIYNIVIPYQYDIDRVSIPSISISSSISSSKSLSNKGGGDKKLYGEFKNVQLDGKEKNKLIKRFGEQGFSDRVEQLSCGIKSRGYRYKNHYATILNWDHREKRTQATTKLETDPRVMGSNTYKNCPKCSYKAKTPLAVCPECNSVLLKDYTAGRLGHMVQS